MLTPALIILAAGSLGNAARGPSPVAPEAVAAARLALRTAVASTNESVAPTTADSRLGSSDLRIARAAPTPTNGPDATFRITGVNADAAPADAHAEWLDTKTRPEGVDIVAGRNSALLDGGASGAGIGASSGVALPRELALEPLTETDLYGPGLAESGEAEFQLFDVNLRWDAIGKGPVEIGLATGVRAVRADVADDLIGGADNGRFQPIPVLGADIKWKLGESAYISGAALTHALDGAGDVVDLKAEAGFNISPKVGFTFGYQIIRSQVDTGPIDATLDQEGAFARFQIRF